MVPLLDQHDLSQPARGDLRRVGGAEGTFGGVARQDRPADQPGVGHDRTLAAGQRVSVAFGVRGPAGGPAGRPAHQRRDRPPGVEMRIVDAETREELPWDETTSGELECRGPWIAEPVLQDRRARRAVLARRLAAHRRRRDDLAAGVPAPGRPDQGPGQVRRRMDQFGRHRERDHGQPEGGRGGRHRGCAPEVGRAAARLRRGQVRRSAQPRGASGISRPNGSRNGRSRTMWCSSTKSPRPASASSRRRHCATSSPTTPSPLPEPRGRSEN